MLIVRALPEDTYCIISLIILLIIKIKISSIVIGLKNSYFSTNQNYNKILERDWLSAAWIEH